MRSPVDGERLDAPRVPVTTTVREIVPRLASSEQPLLATEGDRVVGVVDREAVLRAIAGEGD
jgi:glycine betaine/proline transport system ATP-binding protein